MSNEKDQVSTTCITIRAFMKLGKNKNIFVAGVKMFILGSFYFQKLFEISSFLEDKITLC
ncbi:hypothetical protein CDL12_04063 [Handroanthus impetiginosus]|uniref:Uncharacterized protein n=1 Tax=Handroanthus impetiginosus TaxID=429701 RepID=A0A2G9I0A7_9LAMI|nr:hypothetical protein CDL12_04063 [Handroanthus impetiginosus]